MNLLNLANTNISGKGFRHLSKLDDLKRQHSISWFIILDLKNTQVDDAGLEELEALPHLWKLSLKGTPVTKSGIKHLINHKKLERLLVAGTDLMSSDFEELEKANPYFRVNFNPGALLY